MGGSLGRGGVGWEVWGGWRGGSGGVVVCLWHSSETGGELLIAVRVCVRHCEGAGKVGAGETARALCWRGGGRVRGWAGSGGGGGNTCRLRVVSV